MNELCLRAFGARKFKEPVQRDMKNRAGWWNCVSVETTGCEDELNGNPVENGGAEWGFVMMSRHLIRAHADEPAK